MTSELPHGPHAQKHTHAYLQDQVIDKVAPPNTHTHTQTQQFLRLAAPDSALLAGDLSPPRWTPGTGLHRALYADDGLVKCLKCWTRGSRDRIIATLVNLAKEFGVVKEMAV